MPGRIVRRGAALGLGAVWWWAVLRLTLSSDTGVVEGAVAAGGWGLSVLPVHCVARRRAEGAVREGRWRRAWRVGDADGARAAGRWGDAEQRGDRGADGPRPG
ncbi:MULTISPECIES: hypothetical protein [Streptomyces]|uniref:Uncharacterized protein n=2 Tax=Streptomyces TaxID=1883 RepID=A0ABT9LLQ2_STRGD|nr:MULTISPECIES: hypothetical protein [Streptomyces]MDP9684457.1 hypothetical protein [Streptomyces griseoviridis]GGT05692.1 hypothetical protein GCM10010240_43830 [Streptomyces griseoviridis]GGU51776.1 hypothetical protein GCM10010259_48780 [Streptomyces daghestanicus]GHI30581.1 hypothetical protein Sdagh_23110 [Streptomyces daghestanicus]